MRPKEGKWSFVRVHLQPCVCCCKLVSWYVEFVLFVVSMLLLLLCLLSVPHGSNTAPTHLLLELKHSVQQSL